jgi:Domain of unknown function (DUF4365)
LERRVLECGYALERVKNDYGIDADLTTFDDEGELEYGYIRFQVKSTDRLTFAEVGTEIPQRVRIADLKTWLFELYPIILVVYDAANDRAFWLDVQEHVRERKLSSDARTVTLRIPVKQRLTADAIRTIRFRKNNLVSER